MLTANLAALGAALCWAASGLIAIGPVRAIGSVAFNRLRMSIVFVGTAVAATILGGWQTLDLQGAAILALSGAVGIVMGDTALFWALGRIGPRRNSVIYATNAPITALLAWAVLGEALGPWTAVGIALVTAGVMLAIFFRAAPAANGNGGVPHDWESVRGRLLVGAGTCLIAACCQAAGSVIARPVMAAGADPIAAAAVRVGTSGLLLFAGGLLPGQRFGFGAGLTPRILAQVAVNGFVGLGLGMTLLLIGLAHGNAGVVATLSATSPVLILPMLWVWTRQRPGAGAWAGAIVAVLGVALIVNR
ncbi:DMT family transporter [Azospirillum isscasi]|uniref:DMT family transporter n=1 Tax=Azospirillum isscasi TaxID=3053926 RepID=A0ABU0WLU8_9PROT|nr:DMT family transporter [Azospirillum isscasi]MDQ2105193.1 DMT family transporter [Azospirillum isscasi]